MTMFNEAELIRQLEEQRAVIVQRDDEINRLRGDVEMLTAKLRNDPLSPQITKTGIESMIKGKLISSQRYLDMDKVNDRAVRFKSFIVNVYPVVLRGVQYTIIMDGHHNFAAARLAGIEPDFRPIGKKAKRILDSIPDREREAFLINNITDSNYYCVDNGEVITNLLLPDTNCKFQVHAGNQWVLG